MLSQLPAFLRVLLTTDGTVTKSLESFFWEPVEVNKLNQQVMTLIQALPLLEKQPGSEIIKREVSLKGEHSSCVYALAESYITAESLPENLRADLEHDKVGIGELLRECGLETYRQLRSIEQTQHAELGFCINPDLRYCDEPPTYYPNNRDVSTVCVRKNLSSTR